MRLHPYLSKRQRKIGKERKGDSQCHRVYYMERKLVGMSVHTASDPDHLLAVMHNACREHKFDVPKLRIIDKPERRLFGYMLGDMIVLNAGYHGCNLFTLLHELAHYLDTTNEEDHGPEWVWLYSQLLDRYNVFPQAQFLDLCNEYGIDHG